MTETLLDVRPLSVDESWTFKTQQMHVAGLLVTVWKREPVLQPVRSIIRAPDGLDGAHVLEIADSAGRDQERAEPERGGDLGRWSARP